MTVRAKFYCSAQNTKRYSLESQAAISYEFSAVYDPDAPEDQRFAKATPVGSLSMQVDNPDVTFEPGKYYYLDITPAS